MNWGELKAAVSAYAHRTDLAPMFATFLANAEQRIYFGELNSPKLRIAAMRAFETMATGAQPVGYLESIKVTPSGRPELDLSYRPLAAMPNEFQSYSWDGQTLALSRDQGFPVDLTFYKRMDSPVLDTDTNWLMTNAPNVYLSSLLVEYARWARDDALGVRVASDYSSAVNSLQSQDTAARISGSTLRMKRRT
ncbi:MULTISPECIES: hypothetical protein [unclassified Simplicispira]|uniref:phage adaptor protein n=1 Tax=unclassified Simplicispira TaxID=2630407 RepID=UPI000D5C598C|nr:MULTISPECIES: hypothetical protein [unclassified Simplicispira]PVY56738.1 hypothetical protein C8D04_2002 [Simplicispira sp. 125]REG17682.1 hypothetical protein C8D01_2312 [Simplicispira sp. 110]